MEELFELFSTFLATLSDSVKKRQNSILSQKQQKLRLEAEGKLIPQWSRNSHACGNDYDFVTIFKCGVFFQLIFGKWEFLISKSCQIYFIPKLFISCQFNPLLLILLTRMSIHTHSMPKKSQHELYKRALWPQFTNHQIYSQWVSLHKCRKNWEQGKCGPICFTRGKLFLFTWKKFNPVKTGEILNQRKQV